jgi:thymidylate synthase
MNDLDKNYQSLLQDILDNGVTKQDRTGTGTISAFGRQIRHKMSDGFPLLTTKKMAWKQIVTELLWFLRGDTNIKFLVDNDCHIWDGDAYKRYVTYWGNPIDPANFELYTRLDLHPDKRLYTKEEFIERIKTIDEFARTWGELGPIYGKQWRSWEGIEIKYDEFGKNHYEVKTKQIDQIANSINLLKTNPDSRRLMVNAWNVGELDQMVLPPCHYGFQVYTRELSVDERVNLFMQGKKVERFLEKITNKDLDDENIPKRAISLMWNQRSVDTFLGLPFNIASYGLLLEIIAKTVNMVPDELIGNLGDVHLYSNHVEQAKEQIGRELSLDERKQIFEDRGYVCDVWPFNGDWHCEYDVFDIPRRTREPFPLPTLNINTEFWPTESDECGKGPLDAIAVMNGFKNDNFCKCLLEEDIQLSNYQSHSSIKAPLSN